MKSSPEKSIEIKETIQLTGKNEINNDSKENNQEKQMDTNPNKWEESREATETILKSCYE